MTESANRSTTTGAAGFGAARAGARAAATAHDTRRAPSRPRIDPCALWYARAALADEATDDETRLLAAQLVEAHSPDKTEAARAADLRVLIAGELKGPADA